jgi:hypothetical protein
MVAPRWFGILLVSVIRGPNQGGRHRGRRRTSYVASFSLSLSTLLAVPPAVAFSAARVAVSACSRV